MALLSFKNFLTERTPEDFDLNHDGIYLAVYKNEVAYIRVKNGKQKVVKKWLLKGFPFKTSRQDLVFKVW